jgi:hypothetical protein
MTSLPSRTSSPQGGKPQVVRAPMGRRGWLTLGGVAALVAVVIVGVLIVIGSSPQPKMSRLLPVAASPSMSALAPTSSPLPNLGGPRSELVPEMTLPVGARPYTGKKPTPPGFEFWEVPATHGEIVAQMRSELPTFASFNGRPWCGELRDAMTTWAWGSAAETIGVSFIDGGVMITRLPQPQGCRP